MKEFLLTLMLVFFVQTKIPGSLSRTYDNVQDFLVLDGGSVIRLTLSNGKVVCVPAMFTIIEEK